jgi:hypothetical protein
MAFSQDDLEMKLFGINLGKKEKSIVDTQGNPINSDEQISRRNFIKGAAAATGIALAGAHLFPESVEAGENWKGFARRFANDLPNGFQKELCQEELLGLAYLYMIKGGRDYGLMRTLLTGENARSVHSETVDRSALFCDAGAHIVTSATYMWKFPRETISFNDKIYDLMENKYYNVFSLRRGINDFYDQHVQNDGSSNETEKWLVHSLFSSVEEYPSRGKIIAEEYLKSSFDKRVELISNLKNKLNLMTWKNSDKTDRDISGKSGKGPLNNWNRLLNAQWGAFFLTCHYDKKSKNGGDFIYNNLEKPLRKIGKIRGSPYYFDFKGKYKA